MNFQYNEYLLNLFTIPIFLMIFGVLVLIGTVFDLYRSKRFKSKNKSINSFIVMIFAVAIFISGVTKLNYYVYQDRNSNVLTTTGQIESIVSVSSPPRFHYNNDIVEPVMIQIDNESFYVMYIGDFVVGDTVTINYLPNSNLVMQIDYLE